MTLTAAFAFALFLMIAANVVASIREVRASRATSNRLRARMDAMLTSRDARNDAAADLFARINARKGN